MSHMIKCADLVSGLLFYQDMASAAERQNGRMRINYIRGMNIKKAINRAVQRAVPLSCGPQIYCTIVQIWTTGYKLRTGAIALGLEDGRITGLNLLQQVRLTIMAQVALPIGQKFAAMPMRYYRNASYCLILILFLGCIAGSLFAFENAVLKVQCLVQRIWQINRFGHLRLQDILDIRSQELLIFEPPATAELAMPGLGDIAVAFFYAAIALSSPPAVQETDLCQAIALCEGA